MLSLGWGARWCCWENFVEHFCISRTLVRSGEEEHAVDLGHNARKFGVMLPDNVSPLDNQATH